MKSPFLLKSLLLTLFFAAIFNQQVYAQSAEKSIIDQQNWIIRQQQNILEDKKRDAEFKAIKKERQRQKKQEEESRKSNQINGKMPVCVLIKEIRLNNANLLSSYRKKQLTSPFLGSCMESATLSAIIKAINDYYQNQGYITTQVLVPQQNLQSGIFELQIIEGKLDKITFGKDRFIEKMQKFTAFGFSEDEPLNIKDINQGMYQINRLQSNQGVMKIEPGLQSGDSDVKIENSQKFPVKFTIGKDTLGNDFTGLQRTNFSSNFDNLLFLNDNLNLNYSENLHDKNSAKDSRSFSSSFSIPFKYNTLTYDFSHSDFKGQKTLDYNLSTLTGLSQSFKFTIDRVLINESKLRVSSFASIANKSSNSFSNGVKQIESDLKLSILNLGFTTSYYFNDNSSIYLNPSYSKGLKVLNAKKDRNNILKTVPRAQFDAFKIYANFSKKFTLPKINAPATFVSEASGQYSKQTLYGPEQFSVGGYYSVRGFRENYINGDLGYYFRNKINFNLGSIIAPLLHIEQGFVSKNLIHLNKISFEPFYDYGYVKNNYIDNGAGGRLSGAGLKTIFNSQFFNASVTYSKGIGRSQLIRSPIKEDKILYFELSASCC